MRQIELEHELTEQPSHFASEYRPQIKRKLFGEPEPSRFIVNQNMNIQRFLIKNDNLSGNQEFDIEPESSTLNKSFQYELSLK